MTTFGEFIIRPWNFQNSSLQIELARGKVSTGLFFFCVGSSLFFFILKKNSSCSNHVLPYFQAHVTTIGVKFEGVPTKEGVSFFPFLGRNIVGPQMGCIISIARSAHRLDHLGPYLGPDIVG